MVEWLLEKHMDTQELKARKDGNNCPKKVEYIGNQEEKDQDLDKGRLLLLWLKAKGLEKVVSQALTAFIQTILNSLTILWLDIDILPKLIFNLIINFHVYKLDRL